MPSSSQPKRKLVFLQLPFQAGQAYTGAASIGEMITPTAILDCVDRENVMLDRRLRNRSSQAVQWKRFGLPVPRLATLSARKNGVRIKGGILQRGKNLAQFRGKRRRLK